MRNIRMTIQYDGTNYNGWQIQSNGITIQGVLQEAIKKITGKDAKVTGAGRTDAGVHALCQVASFKTGSRLPAAKIQRALNSVLPDDIRITETRDENEEFHPRFDAASKTYFYIICNSGIISPFLYRYAWGIPFKLDIQAMLRSLCFFEGTHDFSALRASGCGAKSAVRTVYKISLKKMPSAGFMGMKIKGGFLKIELEADAFLRHMARNIVGTAVEAARGRFNPEHINTILASRDRKLAGPTAPARGLFLGRIDYRKS